MVAAIENIDAMTWHQRICHYHSNAIGKYLERYNIKLPAGKPTACLNCKICK